MGQVTSETHGQTELICYSNPPRGFMNSIGANAMLTAFNRAVIDPYIRVIVLTGTDGVFIRQYDLEELIQVADAIRKGIITAKQFDHAPFVDLGDQIAAAPKPVIAAINGAALGGGLELALACDLRIAARSVAQIGLPETKAGIFPGGGGTQRLPRIVGEARALDLILNGAVVDAEEAKAINLVHRLASDAVEAALDAAEDLARKPAAALAAAKKLTRASIEAGLQQGLIAERRAFAELLRTDDAALEHMRRMAAEGLGQAS